MSKTVKQGSMGKDIDEMKRIEQPTKKGTKKK